MTKALTKQSRILLVILSLLPLQALAAVLPTGQNEYEFVYDRLERVDVLARDLYDYQLGPYRIDTTRFRVTPFEWMTELTTDRLALFGFAAMASRSAEKSRGEVFENIRGGLAARPVNKLFIYGSFVLDEKLAEDENYTGKKWRGLAGDVREAFAYYHSGGLELTAGRFASFWGIRNSLIFSRENLFDGLAYSFRWGRLTLSYRLARLDGLNPDVDSVEQFENRYLAAHRLDLHLNRSLRVGLFETVVFGGPGRQIDLFYLNPLIFYHGTQLNEGTNDNTMVGLDFSFKPRSGLKLYGQFLIDDLQVDNASQGDQEPSEIALLLGGYIADLPGSVDAQLEYTRVTNWTFNQILARNRYTHNGKLIGFGPGNDYDLYSLLFRRWFGAGTAATVRLAYYRQGEGRVDADWTAPWSQIEGDYSEPFPTGIVQKTTTLSAGGKSFLRDFGFVDLQIGLEHISHYAHQTGDNRSVLFAELTLSLFFEQALTIQ